MSRNVRETIKLARGNLTAKVSVSKYIQKCNKMHALYLPHIPLQLKRKVIRPSHMRKEELDRSRNFIYLSADLGSPPDDKVVLKWSEKETDKPSHLKTWIKIDCLRSWKKVCHNSPRQNTLQDAVSKTTIQKLMFNGDILVSLSILPEPKFRII